MVGGHLQKIKKAALKELDKISEFDGRDPRPLPRRAPIRTPGRRSDNSQADDFGFCFLGSTPVRSDPGTGTPAIV